LATADSFLSIYLEHRDELLRYARRIIHDQAGAEDVVQEAWFRFSSRGGHAGEIAQPKSYLFTIVRNLAFDWLRRASNSPAAPVAGLSLDSVASDAPSVERILYYRDELRNLEAALSELPEGTQMAFRLHCVEKLTLQETADLLGISLVAVHKRVKRATLHCADRLHGSEED
jgi:RNA polymerase sigma factor (sigma-70 family)